MNRIVLIGNGFDLAHGLPTRYEDFINWYWDFRVHGFSGNLGSVSDDVLCSFKDLKNQAWNVSAFNGFNLRQATGKQIIDFIRANPNNYEVSFEPFFENICKSIETKGWVDIENEYYNLLTKYSIEDTSKVKLKKLNEQLQYIQMLLINYLSIVEQTKVELAENLWNKIYAPISPLDLSIESGNQFREYIIDCKNKKIEDWKRKQLQYGLSDLYMYNVEDYVNKSDDIYNTTYPELFMLPEWVLFLNFNYTNSADIYLRNNVSSQIHIHGELINSQSIIFGYGDEIDQKYAQLQGLNDNECLQNIKSIKYMESDNYKKLLSFIDYAPYQICIMGHSCGNSDRTLLNTLFEHKNCISIKPYYHKKENGDNYLDIVQNISRNFKDMKLMRDRVVNKTYCEPLLG